MLDVRYGKSWALIIGVDAYRRASKLLHAVNDARSVAELLESRYGFPRANISLLLDDDADFQRIRSEFLSYANADRVRRDDRLLVFFAGHGHTISGKRGDIGFLVPVDGAPSDLNSLIRWDELTRNADLISAKHLFFIMDACYGGLAVTRSTSRSHGGRRFVDDMLRRYGRQVLTAGKADEVVADGGGIRPGHSIFTAHLLDALERKAATPDGPELASRPILRVGMARLTDPSPP